MRTRCRPGARGLAQKGCPAQKEGRCRTRGLFSLKQELQPSRWRQRAPRSTEANTTLDILSSLKYAPERHRSIKVHLAALCLIQKIQAHTDNS